MSKMKTKSYLAQFFVLALIFLASILVVLLNFSFTRKTAAIEKIEETLQGRAQSYANDLYGLMDIVSRAGQNSALLLEECNLSGMEYKAETAKMLHASTGAYMVVFAQENGTGITNTGKSVQIGDEPYFNDKMATTYYYVKTEALQGKAAIIVSQPLIINSKVEGHFYIYIDGEQFLKLFPKSEYDGNTFYLLMKPDGTVLASYGLIKEEEVEDKSFYELLPGQEETIAAIREDMRQGAAGAVSIVKGGVAREFVYAPVGIDDWNLVLAVNKKYVQRLEDKEYKETKDFTTKIIFIMSLFVGIVATINIVVNLRQKEHNKTLELKAETDLLTNLYNKMATERKIIEYIETYPDKPAMMYVLDIDNFKKINDTMGHAFGDEVLKSIGYRLKAEFRANDIIGRTGGDEFVIFLKDIRDSNIQKREAERVARFFKNFQVGEYTKYTVTASIGCAVFVRDAMTFESLYKAADTALYKAKKRGKNQLAFYQEEETSGPVEELNEETNMSVANTPIESDGK